MNKNYENFIHFLNEENCQLKQDKNKQVFCSLSTSLTTKCAWTEYRSTFLSSHHPQPQNRSEQAVITSTNIDHRLI